MGLEFDLSDIPFQHSKTAIITGANNGLGFETTKGLVSKNVKVIMACRNVEKGKQAMNEILLHYPNAAIEVEELDLESLASVKDFAGRIKSKYLKLDFLINNAGIMVPPFRKTKDGFESQMGVNYFGHFLLTNLLFDLLKTTPDSRIINLSSIAHKRGIIDFENLNSEKGYSKMKAYSQSKLACLIFAYELQRRISKSGANIKSIAAHPGVSNTNLFQNLPKLSAAVLRIIAPFFTHAPASATLPILYACLGENLNGGEYIGPTGFSEMKGKPGIVKSNKVSYDENIAKKLWVISEKLTGQQFLIK